jgi:hypothetical protein
MDGIQVIELRRTILRAMLWSLAGAAAAGVLAVLTSGQDVLWRAMFTGFAAAGAALLLLPLCAMVDRAAARPAGLFGMGAVVVEFVLVLALIWGAESWMPNGVSESLGMTALVIPVVAVPGLVFVRLVRTTLASWAGYTGVAALAAALVLFMLACWLPDAWWQNDEWWASGWTVAGFGAVTAACLAGAGLGERRAWPWLGVGAGPLAAALLLVHIWVGTGGGERIFAAFAAAALVTAHANLVTLIPVKAGQRWLLTGTIAAALAVGVGVNIFVWIGQPIGDDLLTRCIGAAGILAACGSLALLVLARINRRIDAEGGAVEVTQMSLTCPRCRRKQDVAIGSSECSQCRLRFHIRLEEPRCPNCDYLLYGPLAEYCPECGANVSRASSLPEAGIKD